MGPEIRRPFVEVAMPTFRAYNWSRLTLWLYREATTSRHLSGFAPIEHKPPGVCRRDAMAPLEDGLADAVLMVDDDLVVDRLVNGEPSMTESVVDHVVRVWERAERERILYAPALWEGSGGAGAVYNEARDPATGTVLHGGSAFMLIPAGVWKRMRAAGLGWHGTAEDVRFCEEARGLGMRVEPIPGICVRHRSEWRPPLTCHVDGEGRPTAR